eukprot:1809460-Pleurochrysis_carterae.AAC.1
MALEHQRLLDIADAAAAGRARPPDHPPFARPIQPPLTPSAHGLEGPNPAPPTSVPTSAEGAALVDAALRAESAVSDPNVAFLFQHSPSLPFSGRALPPFFRGVLS